MNTNAALQITTTIIVILSALYFAAPASAQTALWDSTSATSFSNSGTLDRYTNQCMGCHDYDTGSQLLKVNNGGFSNRSFDNNGRSTGHPVGMRYADVANGSSYNSGRYRPVSALSEELILPDGKVSCITCHEDIDIDTNPREHGKLVVSNRGSQLCFECHDF